jgi:Type II secretion system (T2SS), protein G
MLKVLIRKLILLALLLFAVGMAIPKTRARMVEAVTPLMDRFRLKLVPSRLDSMADQLEARLGRGEPYPGNWEGWLRRDFSGTPEDPWGNVYYLKHDQRGFTVGSAGPDGIPNNGDDITEERRLRR